MIVCLHHLACTGGTIMTKCLAAMRGAYVLSEIHPYTVAGVHFEPLAPAAQFQRNYRALEPGDLRSILLHQVDLIYRRASLDGKRLIIRDHSHSDFCVPDAPFEGSLARALKDAGYDVRPIVTIRDPVESFLSLKKQGWSGDLRFDEYCRRWLSFVDFYSGAPLHQYEDFCVSPRSVIRSICEQAEFPFERDFEERLDRVELTGDSGRSSSVVEPRPGKAATRALRQSISESDHFKIIVDRWPEYARPGGSG
jgi:hypothetical protein